MLGEKEREKDKDGQRGYFEPFFQKQAILYILFMQKISLTYNSVGAIIYDRV